MIYDIAIIGAGIAGASLAAALGPHRRVIVLEREDQPGYHSTGRSASFWDECYGGSLVQPLTRASYDFLLQPPQEFSEQGFLLKRGVLYLGRDEERDELGSFLVEFAGQVALERFDRAELEGRIAGLKPGWTGGIYGADCSDIDVAALHAAYLRAARRCGVEVRCRTDVAKLDYQSEIWTIQAGDDKVQARTIVNAAGAWADQLAVLAGAHPLGLTPYRRTIAQLRLDRVTPAIQPLVVHIGGDFYFKPAAGGQIWLSPHDETPCPPCDAAPDELDIATAIHHFEKVVDCKVEAVTHSWAGLRTFALDRLPIFGFDTKVPGFFWCAGQGGFGIQTAPAAASLCANQLLGKPMPAELSSIEPGRYSPARFDS